MRGNGPLFELAQIKEYLPALKPKIVLWFYYEGNDLSNLKIEKQSALLRRYLEGGFTQNLLDRQADIDRVLTEYYDRRRGRRTRTAVNPEPGDRPLPRPDPDNEVDGVAHETVIAP